MSYFRREFICERLRLARRQSYYIVGASFASRINSNDVVAVLNRARRNIAEPLDCIPSDLMTPYETTIRFADSGITERELKCWIKRKRNPAPHFRLNKHTVRFSARLLDKWLAQITRVRRSA